MFHVSAYQFSLHLRRLRRWDRAIDRFVRSTCACLECSIENFRKNFRIRKGGEENVHWGRKLFPFSFICNNIHREIHSKIVLRIGSNLKWKGYSHGDKTLLVGVVKLSKRKERRGKGEKKVSRASLWVQSRATVTHFLYLPHLSVSQVSLVWLVINHEISIYNLW